ncbi:DUF7266 family protein [Natronomonas sp. EA1]|uniref:DUF7266 family protein n=1 Tax=Natronomonas sp. EA1 TaxID=3421655 RepID=UPI003EBD9640
MIRRDDRAVSTTVSYALTLAITGILISGLLVAGAGFVDDQRERASATELNVIGQRLAADVGAADRLALATGGAVTMNRTLTDTVVGSGYRIDVERVGESNTYELTTVSQSPEVSSTVRLYAESPVLGGPVPGGRVTVASNDVLRQKLTITRHGESFAYREVDGLVVIEAELPFERAAGTGAWANHSWEPFDDAVASGDEAIVTRPNVSDSGGTDNTTAGPRLSYPVRFEQAGTYYVWVRLRAPATNPGNSDSVHLGLDGSPATYGGEGLSEGAGTSWTWVKGVANDGTTGDHVTVSPASPGVSRLDLWMREDGTQVDTIILVDNSTYDPNTDPVPSAWWSA